MLVTLVGRLAQFAIMFLSVKLMTSLLEPFQLGRVALITTSIGFFALFLVNPVGMFINRKLHTWFENGSCRTYFHWYGLYIVLVALVAAISLFALSLVGPNLIGLTWAWGVALVGGSLVFNTAIQTLVPSLNMLGRGLSFTVVNIGTLAASLLISYFLCTWLGATAEHWLLGTVIGQTLFTGVAYGVFFKNYGATKSVGRPSAAQLNNLLHFCWPISIAVGLNWAHMQGYRFVLADRFGLEEFGLFAAGYSLAAAFLSAGETILTTWFQPQFYRSVNSENNAERDAAWATYAARMIPATLLCCTALIATSDLLPKVMLGQQYHGVGNYVLVGCFAEIGRMAVGIYVLHAHQHMRTRKLILPNAVGLVAAAIGMGSAFIFLGAGISAAPLVVALGCVWVVAVLWWTDLRRNSHTRLRGGRLVLQAIGLSASAVITLELLSKLTIATTLDALLAGMLVLTAWSFFAFFLRNDLFGEADGGKFF